MTLRRRLTAWLGYRIARWCLEHTDPAALQAAVDDALARLHASAPPNVVPIAARPPDEELEHFTTRRLAAYGAHPCRCDTPNTPDHRSVTGETS
jgi:hypothetical protein